MTKPDPHEACRNLCYEIRNILVPLLAEVASRMLYGQTPHMLERKWTQRLLDAINRTDDI